MISLWNVRKKEYSETVDYRWNVNVVIHVKSIFKSRNQNGVKFASCLYIDLRRDNRSRLYVLLPV